MLAESKLLLLFVFHIFSFGIFLKGFFPIENVSFQYSIKNTTVKRHNIQTSKLVFLIIDAIRLDFVEPSERNHQMPFIQNSIINNKSCFMNIRAQAPTVTMPRIKALTSGTVPNFLDIVVNLGSTEFDQDTFLHQAVNAGLKIVFYGDDTWLKMFPTLFVRSGGTHSFFATDYWEVDKNVTQSIRNELKRDDWDIMIIHYLGLDHIGHMEGPRSKLVPIKLKEMDEVIKEISNVLKLSYHGTKFIVTGDHGMKDSGGHGGVSSSEINVPLIMVEEPCHQLSGWPESSERTSHQVDIASTISIALGVPIPSGSIGKFIPELLNDFSDADILKNLQILKENLLKHINDPSLRGDKLDDEEILTITRNKTLLKEVIAKYYLELTIMSEELSQSSSEYDLVMMAVGCFLQWSCLAVYILSCLIPKPENSLQFLLLFGSIIYSISLGSSSFIEEEHQTWYFLWATFLILTLRITWKRKSSDINNLFAPLIFLCIQHRVLRRLNQTGDKWGSLPDWDDYLRESPTLLFLLFLTSILWLLKYFFTNNSGLLSRLLYCGCLMSIAAYKMSVGALTFFQLDKIYPQSRGIAETQFFYILFTIFLLRCYFCNIQIYWAWSLLVSLTLRPHNLILVPMHLNVSRLIYNAFPRQKEYFWNTLAHIWTGYVFYFYQGNSNSLATIDVAPAFIGCDKYYPIYGAGMTAAHAYAGHIFGIMLSPKTLNSILLLRLFPVAAYTTIIITQRRHLFIWSVFSPKLLLETTLSITIGLLLCLHVINSVLRVKTGLNKETKL